MPSFQTNAAMVLSESEIQGDYLGRIDSTSAVSPGLAFGAQIVAQGNGQFKAIFFTGGLPGDGADSASRHEQTGSFKAGAGSDINFNITQPSSDFTAAILAGTGTLTGKSTDGKNFNLSKVLRKSLTLGAVPPSNAIVLFNGNDLNAFDSNTCIIDNGTLLPQGSASTGAITKKKFTDFSMHLEFQEPYMPTAMGAARGNSGVYLQGRYELQILDSYGSNLDPKIPSTIIAPSQECGAFYELVRPRQNRNFPPLSWQTYDLDFIAAKFSPDGSSLITPANVTVRLNGYLIHDHQALKSATLLGDPIANMPGPLRFQAHGDPVHYRNIWIIEGSGSSLKIRSALRKKSLQNLRSAKLKTLTISGRKFLK